MTLARDARERHLATALGALTDEQLDRVDAFVFRLIRERLDDEVRTRNLVSAALEERRLLSAACAAATGDPGVSSFAPALVGTLRTPPAPIHDSPGIGELVGEGGVES